MILAFAVMPRVDAAPINNSTQVQEVQTVKTSKTELASVENEPKQNKQAQQNKPKTEKKTERTPKATKVVKVQPPKQEINCGDNAYANFIYMKESTCNTKAVNSIGCRGIGQACPGSKLPCGDDYECQNKWFTNYAIQRYGSWEQAYYFWLNNHWW